MGSNGAYVGGRLCDYVGASGQLAYDGLMLNIRIIDVKHSYGATLVCIEPVSGHGTKWVSMSRIHNLCRKKRAV
jgi:hypothetical protein